MQTPVAFFVFNRPNTTERVFASIAEAKPPKLFIIADGPRSNLIGEAADCAAVRAIVERVNWRCEVVTNYSETNLGCRQRISSGISWVFEQVEEAIIMEDDCLPDSTFFPFCESLLDRFRNDERVMHISGCNLDSSQRQTPYSYQFSHYTNIWGWASWRRAWHHYDVEMRSWPALRETSWLDETLGDSKTAAYRRKTFDQVHSHQVNTWDTQWFFACLQRNGLAIKPNNNLISNIGFGEGATHTQGVSPTNNLPTHPMDFPLRHPPEVKRDFLADQLYGQRTLPKQDHSKRGIRARVRRRVSSAVRAWRTRIAGRPVSSF